MYHLLKNSIAYHKGRPLITLRDISKTPLADIAASMVQYETKTSQVNPEHDAIMFYMLNDAFAKISAKFDQHESLSSEVNHVASLYVSEAQNIALRAVYYTLLIITREARHLMPGQYKQGIKSAHGEVFHVFMQSITHKDEEGAVNMLRHDAPDMSLGAYCKGITDVFAHGNFHGSYGGKPWANIANTLSRMVHGETSVETFVDTVWTLCHNGGPIFNKGMLYAHYDQPVLIKILDVQRSGQIPQYVAEGVCPYIDNTIKLAFTQARDAIGEEFGGYVDWFKVVALGAKGHYDVEKKKQVAKYGAPESQKAVENMEKSKFYVLPGVAAKIVKRAA